MNFTTIISILMLSFFLQFQLGNNIFANQTRHSDNVLNLKKTPPNFISLLQIENYGLLKKAQAFPLAVNDYLNIDLSEYGDYEIYLFDINGQKILKRKIHNDIQSSFDLNNLRSGAYILYIIDRIHKQATNFSIKKD